RDVGTPSREIARQAFHRELETAKTHLTLRVPRCLRSYGQADRRLSRRIHCPHHHFLGGGVFLARSPGATPVATTRISNRRFLLVLHAAHIQAVEPTCGAHHPRADAVVARALTGSQRGV